MPRRPCDQLRRLAPSPNVDPPMRAPKPSVCIGGVITFAGEGAEPRGNGCCSTRADGTGVVVAAARGEAAGAAAERGEAAGVPDAAKAERADAAAAPREIDPAFV